MDEKMRESIALFRYGLISPLLNEQVDKKTYLAEVSAKTHEVPYYGARQFTAKTIASWVLIYRREGFHGLKPKGRSDRGRSRTITMEQQDHILALKQQHLHMPATVFYDWLIEQGEIQPADVSYTTIYRLLKKHGLHGKQQVPSPERKRFAHEMVNRLWHTDMSYGPILVNGKQKTKTFLFAFIDDCSRLVPFAQFFPSEKFDGVRTVLKQAMIRRGIPHMIYADNGKIYRSDTLQVACASLGIVLAHTKPYDPQSKGKIERFFLTVQTRFYPLLKAQPVSTLEELNRRFWHWLEVDYHRKEHASLNGKTPLEVYESQVHRVRLVDDPLALDPLFLKREKRKVKHDGTISIRNQLYEVPPRFIGQKIEVRFDETEIYVYEDGAAVAKAVPVRLADNALMKREHSSLSFAQLKKEEIQKHV